MTACVGEPGDPSVAAVPVKLASDPIAYVGHGALFDRDGRQLALTPELVQGIQELYIHELLASADADQRDVFAEKRQRVHGGGAWGVRDTLYANAALIDWLVDQTEQSARPADADRVSGHNALLRNAVTAATGITGRWDAAEYAPPQELRDRLSAQAPAATARAAGAQTATAVGGAAYINECSAAGVPIPPSWGTSGWVSRGVLTNEFISSANEAEVFSYQSSSPAGMCFALPRSSGNSIRLLGIICLGTASSNACFWDNQTPNGQFFPNKGQVVPLDQFFGGADLQKDIGGQCTDCHAGENPFVIHPGTVLGLPNLTGLPLRPNSWYQPRVRADWLQNAGPTNILDSVASTGKCTTCHTQTGAGRFPSVSTAMMGYCGTILPTAFSRTMPPGAVGSSAYQNHYNALIAACQQPPPAPPGLTSPRVPGLAEVNAVSRSTDKLDVFVTDDQGVILTAAWDPGFTDWWHGWWQINGGRSVAGAPVHAVSRSADKLDAFTTGTDGRVYTAAWAAPVTPWGGWWALNGGIGAPGAHVTVVSRGLDKLDAFVVGGDGHVYTAAWQPTFTDWWHGWSRIGDIVVPQGAAIHGVSRSVDHIDLFATDVNGVIWTAAWDPAGWHGWWQLLGGRAAPGAPVIAVSRSVDKLDIFVVGTDGRAYTAAWQPSFTDWWHGWWQVGTAVFPQGASLHAVSRSNDLLDVFGTNTSGGVVTVGFTPATGWGSWFSINGGAAQPGAPVTVVSRSSNLLDAFVVGQDHRVWTAAWGPIPGSWQGWWAMGQ
jgi:hypothetical protein